MTQYEKGLQMGRNKLNRAGDCGQNLLAKLGVSQGPLQREHIGGWAVKSKATALNVTPSGDWHKEKKNPRQVFRIQKLRKDQRRGDCYFKRFRGKPLNAYNRTVDSFYN